MPHAIIEYAQVMQLEDKLPAMLQVVHQAMVATNLFDETHIKLRAMPVKHYLVAGENSAFVHVQLRIHTGRDQAQKKQLSVAVLDALLEQHWPISVITVEVVEMDRGSYAKWHA
ncbi:MAG: 5-carboxymethyl-2-hydroxymuconate Delta-isomerase [Gammaproteobacteria bacterium]|nr:MAG: 5-carboxymethyl-2-hydroxymuconate Delta-isomerase [Gammaproteobacteria bacterium]